MATRGLTRLRPTHPRIQPVVRVLRHPGGEERRRLAAAVAELAGYNGTRGP